MSTRRLLILLLVLLVVGLPAAALSTACVGKSCPAPVVPVKAPFCGLSPGLRTLVENGYMQGRSPDVFAMSSRAGSVTGASDGQPPSPGWPDVSMPWPSTAGDPGTQVPIVFYGRGIAKGSTVPAGTQLDAIAPTVAAAIGLKRPHPEVRAGKAVPGVAQPGVRPSLVLIVAWENVGTMDLKGIPAAMAGLMKGGTGTLEGQTGSLPIDPAASLATIGTGGLPSQHGITGGHVRNADGVLTQAWSRRAPLSVITSLGDDMANQMGSRVAIVESSTTDQGLVGGSWYIGEPQISVERAPTPSRAVAAASRVLGSGLGGRSTTDLLGVALSGSVGQMDAATSQIVSRVETATNGSALVVVTATGSTSGTIRGSGATTSEEVIKQVEAGVGVPESVEAAVPGGLFLNDSVMAERGISGGRFLQALADVKASDGRPVMSQTWPAFSIAFARYC